MRDSKTKIIHCKICGNSVFLVSALVGREFPLGCTIDLTNVFRFRVPNNNNDIYFVLFVQRLSSFNSVNVRQQK